MAPAHGIFPPGSLSGGDAVLIEISPAYVEMLHRRLAADAPLLNRGDFEGPPANKRWRRDSLAAELAKKPRVPAAVPRRNYRHVVAALGDVKLLACSAPT